jgi:hypothetical protein
MSPEDARKLHDDLFVQFYQVANDIDGSHDEDVEIAMIKVRNSIDLAITQCWRLKEMLEQEQQQKKGNE